jgi:hypothetical protein
LVPFDGLVPEEDSISTSGEDAMLVFLPALDSGRLAAVAGDVPFPVFGIEGLEASTGFVVLAALVVVLLTESLLLFSSSNCFDCSLELAGRASVESGAELTFGFGLALPASGSGWLMDGFAGGLLVLLGIVPDESFGILVALDGKVALIVAASFGSGVVLDESVGNKVEMGDGLIVGVSKFPEEIVGRLVGTAARLTAGSGAGFPLGANVIVNSDDAVSVGANVNSLGASVRVPFSMACSESVRPGATLLAASSMDADEAVLVGAGILAMTGDGLMLCSQTALVAEPSLP